MKRPTVSLVISTYNRPDALEACLESVRRQRVMPSEVIIADDGSREETRRTIERLSKGFPVPLVQVWHEDKGFRLAKIRNRAMAQAKGEYIVQTDGDMILSRMFIADHISFARQGCYVKGVRVKLKEEVTKELCGTPIGKPPGFFSSGITDRHKAIRFLPLARWFAAHFKKGKAYGLGCNMAFFKSDLVKVNGYDEAFEGWGREDDDIAHRLHRAGISMRDVRFAAVCYHLWHKENPRDSMEDNVRLCLERDRQGTVRAERGIDQYL